MTHSRRSVRQLLGLIAWAACASCACGELNLVPWPRSVEVAGGAMALADGAHIVAADASLAPLAKVLADDILRAAGRRLAVGEGEGRRGDIVLKLDASLQGEAYALEVGDTAVVAGGNTRAAGWGAVTLLQALSSQGGALSLPRMTVRDRPAAEVHWMWLDCKTQYRSVDDIEQLLTLCSLYKINYMTIQTGMDQMNTLFSESWRDLPRKDRKGPGYRGKLYTFDEMKHLVRYAHDRGVALLPVLPTPVAHQQEALLASFPDLDQAARKAADVRNTLLIDTDEYRQAYNRRVKEVIGLFSDSPYVHIGETAEKAGFAQPAQNRPRVETYLKAHHLRGRNDYFKYYMAQVSKAILAQGRTPVIWAGYDTAYDPGAPVNVPSELVMEHYNMKWGSPEPLLKAGHSIINASWYPYYIVGTRRRTPREVDEWDMRQMSGNVGDPKENVYTAPTDAPVLGTSLCCWERSPGRVAFDIFRPRIPAMAERNWNADAGRSWEDYQKRFAVTDALLERLLYGMRIQVEGLTPVTILYDNNQSYWFADKAQVALSTSVPGAQIRCTLDGKAVTQESTPYAGSIKLDQKTTVRARLFDAGGRPLGLEFTVAYELHPLSGRATGLLDNPRYTDRSGRPDTFLDSMTVALQSARAGGTIRYTLDGKRVGITSPVYADPIAITTPTTVQAQVFGVDNRPVGAPWRMQYTDRGYRRSLTTGAKATDSGGEEAGSDLGFALDGMVDKDCHWAANPCPQWLQVEWDRPRKIGRVELVFYLDKRRYYQYTVEASMDAKTWTKVVDASKNTDVSTEQGYRHDFDAVETRFLRVTVLKNSANPAAHIVELRAYAAE